MTDNNFLIYSGQIILQILGEILYFPLWWYSAGFLRFLRGLGRFWLNQEKILGVGVWAKNLLVPMYGQRDLAGRVISFVMRLVQVVVRGLALLFWLVLVIALALLWLALPILLVIASLFQFLK